MIVCATCCQPIRGGLANKYPGSPAIHHVTTADCVAATARRCAEKLTERAERIDRPPLDVFYAPHIAQELRYQAAEILVEYSITEEPKA